MATSNPTPAERACELSIIVPTFREAANLPILIERCFAAARAAALDAEMVIVDDDSNDGTEALVAELSRNLPVRLVVRKGERGLSSAVLRGFEAAQGEILLVMDADLSHPPERIPDVVRPIREGAADFVIGSRYVKGGATEKDWGLLRWLNSRAATLLARPLTSAHDPMAGFFCLRRATWQRAERLNPVGYKIGLELLVKARCRRVVEVPITFSDRLHGKSKLTARQQIEYLRHLVRLYRFRFPLLIESAVAIIGIALIVWVYRGLIAR